MLFDLFGKKQEAPAGRIFADKVYIGTEAKMNACLELATSGLPVVFIAWFSDTAQQYGDFFSKNGVAHFYLTEAGQFDPAQLQYYQPVFLEHYPLHAKELALVQGWEQNNLPVFSSMDEPLFKHFGSDKMIPFIKLFGMKADAAIEHPYVTESIVKGQKKIADKISTDQPAGSQAEWMEKNLAALP